MQISHMYIFHRLCQCMFCTYTWNEKEYNLTLPLPVCRSMTCHLCWPPTSQTRGLLGEKGKYSQTYVKQPHKGSTKSGRLRQVAANRGEYQYKFNIWEHLVWLLKTGCCLIEVTTNTGSTVHVINRRKCYCWFDIWRHLATCRHFSISKALTIFLHEMYKANYCFIL